jgi:hypothetical protein
MPGSRSAHGERRQLDEALDEPMGNHNGMTRRAARLGRSCGLSARSGSGIGLPYRPVAQPVEQGLDHAVARPIHLLAPELVAVG